MRRFSDADAWPWPRTMEAYEIALVRDVVPGFDPDRGVVMDDHAVLYGTLVETGARVSGKIGWPKWKAVSSEDAPQLAGD